MHQNLINSLWDRHFENNQDFKEVFVRKGTETDYRKYQQFANLIRGMARLDGIDEFDKADNATTYIKHAVDVFGDSLITIKENYSTALHRLANEPLYQMWWTGYETYQESEVAARIVKNEIGCTQKQLTELALAGYVTLLGPDVMFNSENHKNFPKDEGGDSDE